VRVGEVTRLVALLPLTTNVRRSSLTSADILDYQRLLVAAIRDHVHTVAHLVRLPMEAGSLHYLLTLVLVVVNCVYLEGVLLVR
jgi:hypothetical protein